METFHWIILTVLFGAIAGLLFRQVEIRKRLVTLEKRPEKQPTAAQLACEHSWQVLLNEQQEDQRLVITECVKCGEKSETLIGRCNHEWELDTPLIITSPYRQITDPILQLTQQAFKYSNSTKKLVEIVNNIEEKIKQHANDPKFFEKFSH